jgi:phosphoribosyl-AMP cyclohydrolase
MNQNESLRQTLIDYSSNQLLDDLIFSQEPDSLWKEGKHQAHLLILLQKTEPTLKVRFNALLVLAFRDQKAYELIRNTTKADILAKTRGDDFFDYDEHWGRLWEGGSVGTLGQMLVDCGEDAIPSLIRLMGNETVKASYYGSEEATMMAMRHYRVKDFAAYYLARIKDYNLPFESDLKKRDAAIEKMRIDLNL